MLEKEPEIKYPQSQWGFFRDLEPIKDAIDTYGPPKIFNTDQGSQFTCGDFIEVLTDVEVAISMDGRGRYLDNIFIERLWRSLKYEAIYLTEMSDGFKAKRVIDDWITFYNTVRPHSSLDGATPHEAYWQSRNTTEILELAA